VRGDVRTRRPDAADWVPLRVGEALHPLDTVQTMDDGSVTLRFEDSGGTSHLDPRTTLELPPAPAHVARLRHVSGRLRARLEPGAADARLEVHLPPGTLVVGADDAGHVEGPLEAQVEVDDERTEIAMIRGRGRLTRDGGTPLSIEERRYVRVSNEGSLMESGWTGRPVELLDPAPEARVRTRGLVRFCWAPAPGVDEYRLEVGAGGQTPAPARVLTETEAGLELSSGTYRWTVRGLRDGEPQREGEVRFLVVELDRTPPPLQLSSPAAGEEVAEPTVWVRGTTEAGARVTIDGHAVHVSPDGSFARREAVPRGLTNVVVRVSDDLGNARSVSRAVVRTR
ncbi:MAG: hypothetical protein KC619_28220, partial [Myxococcales bacterium]|nr:hypothetical protein [Myxococcales bacterium]